MPHALIYNGIEVPVCTYRTVVIGSGCAGLNAADCLGNGDKDVALLTDGMNRGTSRNTGSDKQTYYKLSIASDGQDSVKEMAKTLFGGGGVNGDIALCEAAGSVRAFMKLVELGVPFPTNAYGEYAGYKTDHDPRQRATSAGPFTSKYMTERLEKSVRQKSIPIFDGFQAIQLLVENAAVQGILALDIEHVEEPNYGLRLFRCANVILATGGPAGIYQHAVYPESQLGGSGMAFAAGARAANLHQWQYGLASVKFRWNVSGTYQQVLPRYIAVDAKGTSREFLPEYFDTPSKALDQVFLKGYQWPFDVKKIGGSSLIDLMIHHEIFDKHNRVYMDFSREPMGLEDGFAALSSEAREYLTRSKALLHLPVNRLAKMNPQAIELYQTHGIDLYAEPLEVSVCAQHHNGGIAVDAHWQSNIEGLFAVGEAAGTFGAYRPGGSALNSTQVGPMRAAEYITYEQKKELPDIQSFTSLALEPIRDLLEQFGKLLENPAAASNIYHSREKMRKNMSACAAHFRSVPAMEDCYREVCAELTRFFSVQQIANRTELPFLMRNRDLKITQAAVLHAMLTAAAEAGSNGSGLVLDQKGIPVSDKLPFIRYRPENEGAKASVLYTVLTPDGWDSVYLPVRPLPEPDDWFEVVWNEYQTRRPVNRSG